MGCRNVSVASVGLCGKRFKLVLLSATVPNTREFASWIG